MTFFDTHFLANTCHDEFYDMSHSPDETTQPVDFAARLTEVQASGEWPEASLEHYLALMGSWYRVDAPGKKCPDTREFGMDSAFTSLVYKGDVSLRDAVWAYNQWPGAETKIDVNRVSHDDVARLREVGFYQPKEPLAAWLTEAKTLYGEAHEALQQIGDAVATGSRLDPDTPDGETLVRFMQRNHRLWEMQGRYASDVGAQGRSEAAAIRDILNLDTAMLTIPLAVAVVTIRALALGTPAAPVVAGGALIDVGLALKAMAYGTMTGVSLSLINRTAREGQQGWAGEGASLARFTDGLTFDSFNAWASSASVLIPSMSMNRLGVAALKPDARTSVMATRHVLGQASTGYVFVSTANAVGQGAQMMSHAVRGEKVPDFNWPSHTAAGINGAFANVVGARVGRLAPSDLRSAFSLTYSGSAAVAENAGLNLWEGRPPLALEDAAGTLFGAGVLHRAAVAQHTTPPALVKTSQPIPTTTPSVAPETTPPVRHLPEPVNARALALKQALEVHPTSKTDFVANRLRATMVELRIGMFRPATYSRLVDALLQPSMRLNPSVESQRAVLSEELGQANEGLRELQQQQRRDVSETAGLTLSCIKVLEGYKDAIESRLASLPSSRAVKHEPPVVLRPATAEAEVFAHGELLPIKAGVDRNLNASLNSLFMMVVERIGGDQALARSLMVDFKIMPVDKARESASWYLNEAGAAELGVYLRSIDSLHARQLQRLPEPARWHADEAVYYEPGEFFPRSVNAQPLGHLHPLNKLFVEITRHIGQDHHAARTLMSDFAKMPADAAYAKAEHLMSKTGRDDMQQMLRVIDQRYALRNNSHLFSFDGTDGITPKTRGVLQVAAIERRIAEQREQLHARLRQMGIDLTDPMEDPGFIGLQLQQHQEHVLSQALDAGKVVDPNANFISLNRRGAAVMPHVALNEANARARLARNTLSEYQHQLEQNGGRSSYPDLSERLDNDGNRLRHLQAWIRREADARRHID